MSNEAVMNQIRAEAAMSTPDIVDRIRKVAGNGYTMGTKSVVLLEAADEIERLRSRVTALDTD